MMRRILAVLLCAVMLLTAVGSIVASAAERGDADGDGIVTIFDATRIQRFLADLDELSAEEQAIADVTDDGEVSILDATRIQRYLAEICNLDGSTPYEDEPASEEPSSQESEPAAAAPDEDSLPYPVMQKAECLADGKTIKITWQAVGGAGLYRVLCKTVDTDWIVIGDTSGTSYLHRGFAYNVEYTYAVRCIDENGNYLSPYDRFGVSARMVQTPVIHDITFKMQRGGYRMNIFTYPTISLHWNTVEGTGAYAVFYRTEEDDHWHELLRFLDNDCILYPVHENTTAFDAEMNRTYRFAVRALDHSGDFFLSGYQSTEPYKVQLHNPTYTKLNPWATASGVSNSYFLIEWLYPQELNDLMIEWRDHVVNSIVYRVFKKQNGQWVRVKELTADYDFAIVPIDDGDDRNDIEVAVRAYDTHSNTYITDYDIMHVRVPQVIDKEGGNADQFRFYVEYR